MRLSAKRVEVLRVLLKQQTGRDYSGEELQQAGLAIVRFIVAKCGRIQPLTTKQEFKHDKVKELDKKIKNSKQKHGNG